MSATLLEVPPLDFVPQLGRNLMTDKPVIAAVNARPVRRASVPEFRSMTDDDLGAVYAYLAAIPHAEPSNTKCPPPPPKH